MVKHLIEKYGIDVKAAGIDPERPQDTDNLSNLHRNDNNDIDMLRYLLEQGALIDMPNELFEAAKNGDANITKYLIYKI